MIRFLFSAVTLLFAAGILLVTARDMVAGRTTRVISPLPDSVQAREKPVTPTATATGKSSTPTRIPTQSKSLGAAISKALAGTHGTYAITVRHLSTGESYAYNADMEFPTASLYKLWVMAAAYAKMESGHLLADERLSSSIPALNAAFNISPEYAEQTEGSISMTTRKALTQMITISHNYAALLLTKRVTLESVRDLLAVHGLNDSQPGEPPVTTAHDIASFLERLYTGKLGNKSSTDGMLALLKKQELNGKIPKNLPKSVAVAHKTGELDYFSHDAGIVFGRRGAYVIVVLTESDNPPAANERIADISRAVYDYFER